MLNTSLPQTIFSQYFTSTFVGAEVLTDNEKIAAAKFSNKRLQDFSTGRFCARQALYNLGIERADILIGDNKRPLWPAGIVGSISHTKYLTGAIVGLSSNIQSVGLDIETIGKINADMWPLIYTDAEQYLLNSYPIVEQPYYTTLLFSFKESFYKLQYPLTQTFLEFTDVEVSLVNSGFELKVLKQIARKDLLPDSVSFNYQQENNQIIACCYIQQ